MKTIQDFEEAVSWLWGEEGARRDYGLQPEIRVYTSEFLFQDVITFMVARDHELWLYYRPKLAIVLMDYGHDELAIDIDRFQVPATRILSMSNPHIEDLTHELRERNAYFLAYKDEGDTQSQQEETMTIERAGFPYRVLDSVDFSAHDFSADESEVIVWKMKGLLYQYLEVSFDQGYASMVIGSSVKELDALYNVLDEFGEIPVHFTHFLLWEKAYW